MSSVKALVPSAETLVKELKEKIFQGCNWDYDKEAIERERQEEEAIRKAKEPPKRYVVQDHQIEKLAEYLVERVHRMQDGELYKVDSCQPTNSHSAITVDTGLMLIALSECLEDRDTAIHAIHEIMWRAVNRIAVDEMQGKAKADISLSEQIELLTMWEENRDKGPLASLCIVAAYFLFDIEPRQGDKEHSYMVGAIGAKLIPDAWEVIATTKNMFCWNLETRIW